jgi:predicted Kef-type K+ transport protein
MRSFLSPHPQLSVIPPQIGEFSFILGELGLSLGLLPREGLSLIVAGALISITLNPLAFAVESWLGRRAHVKVA